MELVRGQRIEFSTLTPSSQIDVGLSIGARPSHVIDISAFCLNAQELLSDDRYFIFYNHTICPYA